jgi:cytochrome c556
MKNIFQTGILVVGAGLVLAVGAASVAAQDSKEAVIKARQDFMEDQQHAVNAVNAFAKGKGDRQAAIDGANKLVDLSQRLETRLPAFFPPGTSNADFPGKTRTKPELWQHLDEVKTAPAKLREAELKLVAVVKTADAQTVGQAMSASYRESCNGLCHNAYRAPEEKKP